MHFDYDHHQGHELITRKSLHPHPNLFFWGGVGGRKVFFVPVLFRETRAEKFNFSKCTNQLYIKLQII